MKPKTFKVFENGIEFCYYGPFKWVGNVRTVSLVKRYSPFLADSTDDEKQTRIDGFISRGYTRVCGPENKPC